MGAEGIRERRFRSLLLCSDCLCHDSHDNIVPWDHWWAALLLLINEVTCHIMFSLRATYLSSRHQSTHLKTILNIKIYPPDQNISLVCWMYVINSFFCRKSSFNTGWDKIGKVFHYDSVKNSSTSTAPSPPPALETWHVELWFKMLISSRTIIYPSLTSFCLEHS